MEPYAGEIRLFAGNYTPEGWLFCRGQLISIQEFEVLYMLLGTTYGGDGKSTFGIPNLSVRLPVGRADKAPPNMIKSYNLGSPGGEFSVTLTKENLPTHTHTLYASKSAATSTTPGPRFVFATATGGFTYYAVDTTRVNMAPEMVSSSGSASPQPHDNIMPTMGINYIIATNGTYPSPA
jgi:microcystin-dependent protein